MCATNPSHRLVLIAASASVAISLWVGAPSARGVELHALTPAECFGDVTAGAAHECGEPNEAQGLRNADSPAVSPDGLSVYAAGYADNSLVRFDRAPDGSLTPMGCFGDASCGAANGTPGLDGIYGVAVSPDGRSVYAAAARDDAIVRFDRAPDGSLTPAGCIGDIGGTHGCGAANEAAGLDGAWWLDISPDGSSVYVASTFDNAIVSFDRAHDGSLTPAGCVGDAGDDHGCATQTAGLAGTRALTVSPDGRSVYATAALDKALTRFNRSADGSLDPAGCVGDTIASEAHECGEANEVQGIDAPRGVAVSPDGASVYVAAHAEDAVSHFGRGADGSLTPHGCIGDATAGVHACGDENETVGLDGALQVVVSRDGTSVYVASSGDDAVLHFERGVDGSLAPVGCLGDAVASGAHECGEASETPGLDGSRAVALDPGGASLYVAAYDDHAVVRLNREVPPHCLPVGSSGAFAAVQSVALDCFDPNGDPLSIAILSAPEHGDLGAVEPAGGTVAYTPHAGFSGPDGFTYRAVADGKDSEVASAALSVLPPAELRGPEAPEVGTGEPVATLLALLGRDRYTARRGRPLTIRFTTSAPGLATIKIRKGARKLVSIRRTVKSGRGYVKWSGRVAGRRGGLAPGRYSLALSLRAADDQGASDSAPLSITR